MEIASPLPDDLEFLREESQPRSNSSCLLTPNAKGLSLKPMVSFPLTSSWFFLRQSSSSFRDSTLASRSDLHRVSSRPGSYAGCLVSDSTSVARNAPTRTCTHSTEWENEPGRSPLLPHVLCSWDWPSSLCADSFLPLCIHAFFKIYINRDISLDSPHQKSIRGLMRWTFSCQFCWFIYHPINQLHQEQFITVSEFGG